jgi:hypothetical protein
MLLAAECSRAQPNVSPERAAALPAYQKKPRKYHCYVEANISPAYFPIYGMGGAGYYNIDGHRLMPEKSTLQYYCAIPGQKIWAYYTTDPTDQATQITGTFTLSKTKPKDPEKIRRLQIVAGVTHDKAQTEPNTKQFRLENGGFEATLLASYGWQLGEMIKQETHDDFDHLKIDLFFQAGPIFSFNEDSVILNYNGTQVYNRYRGQTEWSDRRFEGYGFVGYVHTAFGYGIARWTATIGFNTGGEWQHEIVPVTVNGADGHRLTLNSYSLFLTPMLNVRFRISRHQH